MDITSKSVAFESHDLRMQVFFATEPAFAEVDDEVLVHFVWAVIGELELTLWPIYLVAKLKYITLKIFEGETIVEAPLNVDL